MPSTKPSRHDLFLASGAAGLLSGSARADGEEAKTYRIGVISASIDGKPQ